MWKVSVVVPIYNVEKYIYRCIDSIINQTYSNIEIILVDDGSTDKCGEIIKDFSKADSRIKIIHKKNGGLSDARNKGMEYVSGEFVLFVDSDDWLDTKIIEEMINNCLKYNADIVQTAFYYAYDDYLLLDNRIFSKDDHIIILNNISLMSELVINERVKNFAWGKLYKTDLIKDIPFEKGVLFEDVFWAHKVMHRVNKYVILNQPLCYYYQRSDSIVSTYTLKNLDIIKGLKKRHKFIEEYYKDLTDKSYKVILKLV
ncbi:glycosyltransferase family 2 protein [Metabacillus idriensis]|uniref:glycosyltransferase family 2 protein n=1 Tax=Metabacillus idriensis TaxID=324768 RepID=UPI001CD1A2DF|nr:glycosyltransferase family 2 protein [Metabacillus idriensis]